MAENFQRLEKNGTESSSVWKCRDIVYELGPRPLVMGILNITPDSFSDGSLFMDRSYAVEHAISMTRNGCPIIDVGGESTRPGAQPVSVEEELRRVVPVVERLILKCRPSAISVDTTKAEVAEAALAAGAHIVNDISACTADPRMVEVVKKHGAGVVLMHMKGTPRTMQNSPNYADVVGEVGAYLRERVEALVAAGIAREAIAVDPGIGFGKTVEHNIALLAGIPALRAATGRPLVIGASRKSFLGKLLNIAAPADRVQASLWTMAYAAARGAEVFRVHDVKESCELADLLASLRAAERVA